MPHFSDSLQQVRHPDGRVLIGGSFRGVGFFVESHNRTGGRRIVTHEFAKRDIPGYSDLGRKARGFRITAYVLGEKYTIHRDALLTALEDTEGASTLIHPYLGPKRVRVGDVVMSESIAEGGVARFQIEFLDAPLSSSPTIVQDLSSLVKEAAATAAVQNKAVLLVEYDVGGQPTFATESLSGELTALSESLEDALRPVVADIQELAKLNVSIDLLILNAVALVREPGDMLDDFIAVVSQLGDTILNFPRDMVGALMDAYDTSPTIDVLGDTATRAQERVNQLALSDALCRALVIQASVMVTDAGFETVGDATDLRDRIIGALDALASTAGDEVYTSILDLRAAVARAVPGDRILASEQTIHRNVDLPSLVLSHQLYGDTSKAGDIVDRNSVQHPAFISGDIKVLTFG